MRLPKKTAQSAVVHILKIAALLAALLSGLQPAVAADWPAEIRRYHTLTEPPQAAATHYLELRAVNLDDWPEPDIIAALREAAQILAQCGIAITRLHVMQIQVPDTHRYFETQRARALAHQLGLPRPAVFFTAGTRQVPAFDAEAIGRGNSHTRPELRDTVWVAKGARDLGIVVAHELAHVLMDSGEHVNTPGNLMAESTTPGNTQISPPQCARMTATGERHGLLRGVN